MVVYSTEYSELQHPYTYSYPHSPKPTSNSPKGAHWDALNDQVQVSTNPFPEKSPVACIRPPNFAPYKLNPGLASVPSKGHDKVVRLLVDPLLLLFTVDRPKTLH